MSWVEFIKVTYIYKSKLSGAKFMRVCLVRIHAETTNSAMIKDPWIIAKVEKEYIAKDPHSVQSEKETRLYKETGS